MFQIANLINFLMRGLALFGKFILFFFMAKYMSPSELGVYSIFVSFVIFSVYVVGLDFYTYSTRELVVLDKSHWGSAIKSQLFLLGFTYFLGLPFLLYLSTFFISKEWLIFLCILIILEHLNQEIMRLLIADDKAFLANNLFFVRNGLWCYIVIFLMSFSLIGHTIENVFIAWLCVGIFVLGVGSYNVFKTIEFKNSPILYDWIKKGIKTSFIFLLITILARVVMTLDKLWLQYLEGVDKVAVYALFFGVTSVLLAILEASCFSFLYPKMIKHKENKSLFLNIVYQMLYGSVIIIILLSVFLAVLLPYFLSWIGKPLYIEYKSIFYVLLLAHIVYGLSMVLHYVLYAFREDWKILYSQLLGFFIFIVTTWLFVFYNVEMAVAYGLLFSFVAILAIKLYYVLRLFR